MELKLQLRSPEREAIQQTLEALQDAPKEDIDEFLRYILNGRQNALQLFLKGAYDNPKTWWIGVFAVQMQTGLFGTRLQRMAASNAGVLNSLLAPVTADLKSMATGGDSKIVSNVVRYALKYHRSLVLGRLAGGTFTSFAAAGGLMGSRARKKLPRSGRAVANTAIMITNWGLASYGAGIMAIGLGRRNLRDILFSVLTGSDIMIPPHFELFLGKAELVAEEYEQIEWLTAMLDEISHLTQIGTGPVPISEFCSRPENINLKGICR